MSVRHGRFVCPKCSKLVDLGHGLESMHGRSAPRVGDVTICASCLAPLRFDQVDQLAPLSGAALEQLDPRLRSALAAARYLMAAMGRDASN